MSFLGDFTTMLGGPPRHDPHSPAAAERHEAKRGQGAAVREQLAEEKRSGIVSHKWRNRRWATIVIVNLLFTLSFWLDIQLVEGSLTASRFLGFHLADIYSSFLIVLAQRHVPINLLIGAVTVWILWTLLGGRAFCSWVCPYHLLAEFAEALHVKLANKKLVQDHPFHRGVRSVLWVLFALLALATQQTLFLTLNPIGILSRAVVYGPSLALGWVLLLLTFEIVYSRRAWCRYVCPIGLTYGLIGSISPLRVRYTLENCAHEGECRAVCEVPHVLDLTIKGRASDTQLAIGPDCTRCGLCIDKCPTGSLSFEIKGLSDLL